MDQMNRPTLVNDESPFPSANSSSFSLSEIWPFQLGGGNVGLGESSGVLGNIRRDQFEQNLSGIGNPDVSVDESNVTDQTGRIGNGSRKRMTDLTSVSEDESKLGSTSSGNEMNGNGSKRRKTSESRNGISKTVVDANSGLGDKPAEQSGQPSEPEPPKQDYIHVRARRGQATDSHSLAERARREKISERMRILQDLVPGCNKVIGKALVLDEIINYIQSLQRQVEFLSMKLEAVNSRLAPNIDGFPPKDTFDAGMTYIPQGASDFGQGSQPEWLHMQVGSGFERPV